MGMGKKSSSVYEFVLWVIIAIIFEQVESSEVIKNYCNRGELCFKI